MASNTKLTDAQRVILAAAAARESGLVLPLPKSLGNNRGTHGVILNSLLARALVAERPVGPGEDIWRQTDDHNRSTLVITTEGLSAIGIDAPGADDEALSAQDQTKSSYSGTKPVGTASEPPGLPKSNSKLGALIAALRRPEGATIADLTQVTGWQAHSVRGAISGNLKKKLKLTVLSEVAEGRGRVYHISATGAAQ